VIPDSVTSIGWYAFYNCTSLKSIEMPDSVTSIGDGAFGGCTSLARVNISDLAAWCNISFGNSYSNPLCCANNLYLNGELVTELVIPEGVTEIKDYVFYNCTSLKSVEIPDSVTSIGRSAFEDCTSLTSIIFDDTSDWYRTDSYTDWKNQTGGTQKSVIRADINATYFTSNYYNYYWYKK